MPNGNTSGVVGTDGIIPVYDPDGKWAIWGLHEVWMGDLGEDRYVPKVKDYVIDVGTYTTYIVDFLDPVSLIPTLREIRPSYMSGIMSETDVLFGVGPGTQSDTYRIYIDKFTTPFSVAVDQRLKIGGNLSSYAKIFKGSDLGETGEVISMMYDNSGNFISNNVPLELVALDNHTNYAIRSVKEFKTTKDLLDGEIVTAVFYRDNGGVVSKRQLLVENTAFIRSTSSNTKYVSHISLETPFISTTGDNLIEFPLNVPNNALNLIGVVHYSDGSIVKMPVDGSKFKMLGIDHYLSSIEGQETDVVLSYALSNTEVAYNGVTSDGKYITETYTLRTVNPNYSYSVKLFAYPEWVSPLVGYRLKWFLFNLDRNIRYDVSDKIQFNPNTGVYDPKGYGTLQRKQVSVNLRQVSGAFKDYLHTQVADISLYGTPSIGNTPWVVSHEANTNHVAYGLGLLAKRAAQYDVKIDCGIATREEWLERVYLATYPLMDASRETTPQTPTHMFVRYTNTVREVPIQQWNTNINVGNVITPYSNVYITFIRRTGVVDAYLSEAAMMIMP